MQVIHATNVNDAFVKGAALLRNYGVKSNSRAGPVTTMPVPVTTVYTFPTERVLFNAHRDANPFFHFFEALWMLNGMDDATWLDQFVGDFSVRFAEEGGIQWGAYGHRWRNHFNHDQLDGIVDLLTANPDDRRAVIQMWDVDWDLGTNVKDVPCNTHIYPRIVNGRLDITVCCRSNDMIWGAYGSNMVHFSMLQEYLAGRIGVDVGLYYQISNNMHVYDATADKLDAPFNGDAYPGTEPMGNDWDEWDADLAAFFYDSTYHSYTNEWFNNTVYPMWMAHKFKKEGNMLDALSQANNIKAPDWRLAAIQWLERRIK